jgi:2-oxoglutarate-Fe(II)-dependent oxygenase superfamily protein
VIELADVLSSRDWLSGSQPFPHLMCRDVFTAEFHAALCAQLAGLLGRGLSEGHDPTRMSRSLPGYDAYAIGFGGADGDVPTSVFTSAAWRDLFCGLFGTERTPYVFAGAHHHAAGGVSGYLHNDLNPVWFPVAEPGSMQSPDGRGCSYKTGAGNLPADRKIQVVRAVAVLYFLLNDEWRTEDGGEIGLYDSASAPVGRPLVRCPPLSNSVIAFECTPRSYHAYLANRRCPRTSIIMWTHRSTDDAIARFGEDKLERFTS